LSAGLNHDTLPLGFRAVAQDFPARLPGNSAAPANTSYGHQNSLYHNGGTSVTTMHHGYDTSASDPHAQAGLAAFAALVLADEALQARLGAIEQPDAYVADAVAIAAAHGIVLDMEAIRPDRLGISRGTPSPVTLDRWPPCGWLPAQAVQTGVISVFDWAWFGPQQLDMPFYGEAVQRFAPRPFNRMFRTRTSLATLMAGACRLRPPHVAVRIDVDRADARRGSAPLGTTR